MKKIKKSKKLENVNYAIRGNVLDKANELENSGIDILKLNIGNPSSFGFSAPKYLISEMKKNLEFSQGYSDSKGLYSARKAIRKYYEEKGVLVDLNNIYIGNGVSELILLSMQALLNKNDEILVPRPDYPLWTASVNLVGGKAIHYECLENDNWYPNIEDIRRKITKKTRGIVIINPNNPTGALYPKYILEGIIKIARENNLIIFSDEIYDRLVFDDLKHISIASLDKNVPIITFSGLSKSHMMAGFRIGWMAISGNPNKINDYLIGLNLLSSMRLCANVPGQSVIEKAILDTKSTKKYLKKGGRLYEQRELLYNKLKNIDGISVVKPKAAFYIFPRIDKAKFNITDDEKFALDFLNDKHIMFVHGTGFNYNDVDHFRLVYLADVDKLNYFINSLTDFLSNYKQK